MDDSTFERLGRHEEKLNNLEKNVTELKTDVKEGQEEIRTDIKELVATIQKIFETNQEGLSKRIDKLENIVNWAGLGLLATVGGYVWKHVTGGG